MRIKDPKKINELIDGHNYNLENTFSILELINAEDGFLTDKNIQVDFASSEIQMRYFCFVTACFLDLLTVLKGLTKADTDWEVIHYSKSGFHTIYESINTYHSYQKEFRALIENEHPDLTETYQKVSRILKAYKKDHQYDSMIKNVRHRTTGHYDKDFMVFYRQILSLNKDESIEAIEGFLDFLSTQMWLINEIVQRASEQTNRKAKEAEKRLREKTEELRQLLIQKEAELKEEE